MEIVEVINAMRGPAKAELRHDNFMAKVAGHPGINGLNFQGVYSDAKGETRRCYYLPKREAELMVMSESLEVQTLANAVIIKYQVVSESWFYLKNFWDRQANKDTLARIRKMVGIERLVE